MSASAISEGEVYRNKLRAAGITPDKPLFEVLDGAAEDRRMVRAALDQLPGRLPPVISDDAVDSLARAFVERLYKRAAHSMPLAAMGCVCGAVVLALGVGYAAGRYAQAAEVRTVERGLALSLPAGSAWLDTVRKNPDGCARVRTRPVKGGEVDDMTCWRVWPGPGQ